MATIFSAAENIHDGLPQEREKFMEQGAVITHYASQLNDLVDQVLLFTTTAKGKPWHAVQPLAVSDILRDCAQQQQLIVEESGSSA